MHTSTKEQTSFKQHFARSIYSLFLQMCELHSYSPASPWTGNPECPHFLGLAVCCYTILSGVPGEEPKARQMLYLCVLSGSLDDPIFQNYTAQSEQSSPPMSITKHCRTCAIVFSHCAPGPVHTECLLKNTQTTLGTKIPKTRLSQWEGYISGCSSR